MFQDLLRKEKEYSKNLVKKAPIPILLIDDLDQQKMGIDAYIDTGTGYEPYDFKFAKSFFLEREQASDDGWCTTKHNGKPVDPNIKIWFIGIGVWYLGDLEDIKQKAIRWNIPYHTVKTTGTTGWFLDNLGNWLTSELYKKRLPEPFEIKMEDLKYN